MLRLMPQPTSRELVKAKSAVAATAQATATARNPESLIRVLRDQQVVLDEDLAQLYGVETGALTRAVRRNASRFPEDFMFQLTQAEFDGLRSQFGISNRGGRRYRPYVFTEQGVAMLSSVLRSEQAVAVNIEIMRAFVAMRQAARSQEELVRRLDDLEKEMLKRFDDHDQRITLALKSIKTLMGPTQKPKAAIGFVPPED
jgi:hypothetical protein